MVTTTLSISEQRSYFLVYKKSDAFWLQIYVYKQRTSNWIGLLKNVCSAHIHTCSYVLQAQEE